MEGGVWCLECLSPVCYYLNQFSHVSLKKPMNFQRVLIPAPFKAPLMFAHGELYQPLREDCSNSHSVPYEQANVLDI